MVEITVTATLWLNDDEVDRNDRSGLTSRAYDMYIVPLMNQGFEDVETSLA